MGKIDKRLKDLERAANPEDNVIGVVLSWGPDVVHLVGGGTLSHEEYNKRFPNARQIDLEWGQDDELE